MTGTMSERQRLAASLPSELRTKTLSWGATAKREHARRNSNEFQRRQTIVQLQALEKVGGSCTKCRDVEDKYKDAKRNAFMEIEHLRQGLRKCLDQMAGFMSANAFATFSQSLQLEVRFMSGHDDDVDEKQMPSSPSSPLTSPKAGGSENRRLKEEVSRLEEEVESLELKIGNLQDDLKRARAGKQLGIGADIGYSPGSVPNFSAMAASGEQSGAMRNTEGAMGVAGNPAMRQAQTTVQQTTPSAKAATAGSTQSTANRNPSAPGSSTTRDQFGASGSEAALSSPTGKSSASTSGDHKAKKKAGGVDNAESLSDSLVSQLKKSTDASKAAGTGSDATSSTGLAGASPGDGTGPGEENHGGKSSAQSQRNGFPGRSVLGATTGSTQSSAAADRGGSGGIGGIGGIGGSGGSGDNGGNGGSGGIGGSGGSGGFGGSAGSGGQGGGHDGEDHHGTGRGAGKAQGKGKGGRGAGGHHYGAGGHGYDGTSNGGRRYRGGDGFDGPGGSRFYDDDYTDGQGYVETVDACVGPGPGFPQDREMPNLLKGRQKIKPEEPLNKHQRVCDRHVRSVPNLSATTLPAHALAAAIAQSTATRNFSAPNLSPTRDQSVASGSEAALPNESFAPASVAQKRGPADEVEKSLVSQPVSSSGAQQSSGFGNDHKASTVPACVNLVPSLPERKVGTSSGEESHGAKSSPPSKTAISSGRSVPGAATDTTQPPAGIDHSLSRSSSAPASPFAAATWNGGAAVFTNPGSATGASMKPKGLVTGVWPPQAEPYILHVWEQRPHGVHSKDSVKLELISLGAIAQQGSFNGTVIGIRPSSESAAKRKKPITR